MNRIMQHLLDGATPGDDGLWPMHTYPAPTGINGKRDKKHRHVEAFSIMKYADTSRQHKALFIWNSRDGVTPFVVFVDGVEYQHIQWPLDKYSPNYRPAPGDLIFRDITPDEAKLFAGNRIEQLKGTKFYPETDRDRDQLAEHLAEEMVGKPMLARVTAISFTSDSINR